MTLLLVIGVGWLTLACLVAVVIGRSIRMADDRAAGFATRRQLNFVVDPAPDVAWPSLT